MSLSGRAAADAKPAADFSLWQNEPFRLLFPLGALLGWAGVFHWLLLAVGAMESYRSIYHAMTQIQGFMTCFATGFLFTFIPRRTRTPPPQKWELAFALLAPPLTVFLAWHEAWAMSQLFWLALMVVVLRFAVTRFRRAPSAPPLPPSLIWVPLSLAMGMGGALLAGIAASRGPSSMWLHDVGRGLVLQAMFSGLVMGVGGFLFGVVMHGAPPQSKSGRQKLEVAIHAALAALFLLSFFAELLVSARLGFAARAAVALVVLVSAGKIHRPPSLAGLHRKLIWIAAWMLPLGYLAAALWPEYRKAALHAVFIGCFALMALCVSTHVTLSHTGRGEALVRSPLPVAAFGLALCAALIFRVLLDLFPFQFRLWLGLAASCFLLSTVAWGFHLLRPARAGDSPRTP
jgi:uncharacterized protein involved in response to NO